ncbi:MAG: HAD family hydrolase [Actinobacteria bacterium]|jgi:HAD superfamily hydrolase (TIGR01549 family)|nr:HAD family hydrolase [Actinomycetota bacterium]
MSNSPQAWPSPEPVRGVIFDIHSTLIDQGSADEWLAAALAVAPHPLDDTATAELVAFLDRIWEGARVSDPDSSRDLSFEAHSRVFHELIADGPSVDRTLANALYDVMLDGWHAYADTVPTLRALREAGVKVCLLSNAGVPIRRILDREGVSPHVDGVVLSYEVGCVKPDHRIFRAAVNLLGLEASQVLMVGDNANDDGGGASLGLRTLILPRTSGPVHGLSAVTALVLGVNAERS